MVPYLESQKKSLDADSQTDVLMQRKYVSVKHLKLYISVTLISVVVTRLERRTSKWNSKK